MQDDLYEVLKPYIMLCVHSGIHYSDRRISLFIYLFEKTSGLFTFLSLMNAKIIGVCHHTVSFAFSSLTYEDLTKLSYNFLGRRKMIFETKDHL
jgi:hypothetical protein